MAAHSPGSWSGSRPGNGAALLATYRTFMFANHDAFVTVYPGIFALLAALHARGIPTGIVTSKARISAAPSFARFLLDREMAVIVVEDDTERHKPHPDPLLHAARLLDLPPAACWYIGDSTHDMIAAHAAGMTGIGAAWGPNPAATSPPSRTPSPRHPPMSSHCSGRCRTNNDYPFKLFSQSPRRSMR